MSNKKYILPGRASSESKPAIESSAKRKESDDFNESISLSAHTRK